MDIIERTLLANQVDIDSLGNGTAGFVAKAVEDARRDLLKTLKGTQITAFTKQRSEDLLLQTDHALESLFEKFGSHISERQRAVIRTEFATLSQALAKQTRTRIDPAPKLPLRDIEKLAKSPILGKKLTSRLDASKKGLARRAKVKMGSILAQGKGTPEAEKVLRETLGLSRNSANVTARTAYLDAAMKSRDEVYKQHSSLIKSYTFLATLDSRTCMICGIWDGRTEEKREALPDPPLHGRCRCFIRPNTRFAEPIERPAVLETEAKTVHHKDGSQSTKFRPVKVKQVSSATSYKQFFKFQPEAWQRSVLGSRRFDLYKAGKVTLDDLVGGTFKNQRVLSLSELESKIAKGGKAARKAKKVVTELPVPKAAPATPKAVPAAPPKPEAKLPPLAPIVEKARVADYAEARGLVDPYAEEIRTDFLKKVGKQQETLKRASRRRQQLLDKQAALWANTEERKKEITFYRRLRNKDYKAYEASTGLIYDHDKAIRENARNIDKIGRHFYTLARRVKRLEQANRAKLLETLRANVHARVGTRAVGSFLKKAEDLKGLPRVLREGEACKSAEKFLGELLPDDLVFLRTAEERVGLGISPGACYCSGTSIYMNPSAEARVWVHEISHIIEDNANRDGHIVTRSRAFRFTRASETPTGRKQVAGLAKMSEYDRTKGASVPFNKREFYFENNIDATPIPGINNYVTKTYDGVSPKSRTSVFTLKDAKTETITKEFGAAMRATEVISVGVDTLYDNPVYMAVNDPDYFRFILEVIQGWI